MEGIETGKLILFLFYFNFFFMRETNSKVGKLKLALIVSPCRACELSLDSAAKTILFSILFSMTKNLQNFENSSPNIEIYLFKKS